MEIVSKGNQVPTKYTYMYVYSYILYTKFKLLHDINTQSVIEGVEKYSSYLVYLKMCKAGRLHSVHSRER